MWKTFIQNLIKIWIDIINKKSDLRVQLEINNLASYHGLIKINLVPYQIYSHRYEPLYSLFFDACFLLYVYILNFLVEFDPYYKNITNSLKFSDNRKNTKSTPKFLSIFYQLESQMRVNYYFFFNIFKENFKILRFLGVAS